VNAGEGGQQAPHPSPAASAGATRPPGHLALPVPARDHCIYIPTHNRVHDAPAAVVDHRSMACAEAHSRAGYQADDASADRC
jgi:hypothetical protein